MEWSTTIVGVPGCRNKPTVYAGNCCVGGWVTGYGRWRITHGRCSTLGASNHKSTRATPSSFASDKYNKIEKKQERIKNGDRKRETKTWPSNWSRGDRPAKSCDCGKVDACAKYALRRGHWCHFICLKKHSQVNQLSYLMR